MLNARNHSPYNFTLTKRENWESALWPLAFTGNLISFEFFEIQNFNITNLHISSGGQLKSFLNITYSHVTYFQVFGKRRFTTRRVTFIVLLSCRYFPSVGQFEIVMLPGP